MLLGLYTRYLIVSISSLDVGLSDLDVPLVLESTVEGSMDWDPTKEPRERARRMEAWRKNISNDKAFQP